MKPYMFIGSSAEGKSLADAIQYLLRNDAQCTVWAQAFPLSSNTTDALLENCRKHDFAAFVFSPDDTANIRDDKYEVARDNVLFEAGLFMGMRGRERVFIITPQNTPSFHIPTDLLGFTPATYDPDGVKRDVNSALGPAATEIKRAVAAVQARRDLSIQSHATVKEGATFPLKLHLRFSNPQPVSALIHSTKFFYDDKNQRAPNALKPYYVPEFIVEKVNGKDVYYPNFVLRPEESIEVWVPFDPAIGVQGLKTLANSKRTGTLQYSCEWDDTRLTHQEKV